MEEMRHSTAFWHLLHSISSEAVNKRGVPDDIAAAAAGAVIARFEEYAGSHLDDATRRRVVAYFWGAVRRRAIRHAPRYARRVVQATLAADLTEAGWDSFAIRTELERAGLSA